ncbi:MAG: hypothetical protein ACK4HQ_00385 [Brevinematales bacterium]
MKRWLFVGMVGVLFSCARVDVIQENERLTLTLSHTKLVLVFPETISLDQRAFYTELFRRLTELEKTRLSDEVRLTGDPYQDTFLIGNKLLKDWKNLTLRWAWIQQVWETMRYEAEVSRASWASFLKKEMISYARIRDFEDLFRKYQLSQFQVREARQYLIQFLIVEVYFVSLQELMERYGRYYTMNDLPTVFFQLVVLPESVEWLTFLQTRYGKGTIRQVARMMYDKQAWEKKLGKPVSDLESEFVKGLENKKFTMGIWANLGFVHEYQNFLALYNQSTKQTLFKK